MNISPILNWRNMSVLKVVKNRDKNICGCELLFKSRQNPNPTIIPIYKVRLNTLIYKIL